MTHPIDDNERDARADVHARWTTTLTCLHASAGLCPACLDESLSDPDAWFEFGNHPAGLARWRRLEDEISQERVNLDDFPDLDDLPF